MKVKDLITKLSLLDPEKRVYIDETGKMTDSFKFVGVNYVEEVETSIGEEIVLISAVEYDAENEEEDETFLDN